jgi:hypothetical protein
MLSHANEASPAEWRVMSNRAAGSRGCALRLAMGATQVLNSPAPEQGGQAPRVAQLALLPGPAWPGLLRAWFITKGAAMPSQAQPREQRAPASQKACIGRA